MKIWKSHLYPDSMFWKNAKWNENMKVSPKKEKMQNEMKIWKSHLYPDRTTQPVQGWTWVDSPESSVISEYDATTTYIHSLIVFKCKILKF